MKDTFFVLFGTLAAITAFVGLGVALFDLTQPVTAESMPKILTGLTAYIAGWAISLWAFPR